MRHKGASQGKRRAKVRSFISQVKSRIRAGAATVFAAIISI